MLFPFVVLELNKDNLEKKEKCFKLLAQQFVDAHIKSFITLKNVEELEKILRHTGSSDNTAVRLYTYIIEYIKRIKKSFFMSGSFSS